MVPDVKRIKIYRRDVDAREWVADCLVRVDDPPKILDCTPVLREDVKKALEQNLLSVKGQIWLRGEIPVLEETYVWVSEDAPEESNEKT